MNVRSVLLLLCFLLTLINIVFSVYYIYRVKSFWRYIKIGYVFANLFMAVLFFQALVGVAIDQETQLLAVFCLLLSIAAGLIVSQTKIRVAEIIDSLEIHWEIKEDNSE